MKFEAISNRFVRIVAPYFIGLFSLLSVSANNFPIGSTISSPVNPPVITLNVTDIQIIEVGSSYTELGATAQDNEDIDEDLTSAITISGVSGVNTSVIGDYNVIYSVTDSDGNSASETRIVRVVDSQPPVVTITGSSPISIEVGSTYYELGATAADNYDPSFSVTNSIVTTGTVTEEVLGEYTITYSAQDSSGNVGTAQRTVNVVDTTSPTIDITGDNPVTITLGATYNDEGATATDNYDTGLTVVVGGDTVDTSTVGSYTVTYNLSDAAGNTAAQKVRTVNVVDNTDPIITLIGSSEITHEVGTTYDDPGATANDNYDGDLSSQISTDNNVNPNLLGTYTVEYTVQDSSKNDAQRQRTVNVVDTVDPVITLVGNTTVTIEYQSIYTDAGATATDNYDGNLNTSLTSSSTVNSDELGTYAFTYTVSDSSSNTAQVSRSVIVEDSTPPTISLIGSAEINLQVGDSYIDGGATAVDAHDGDVTADIVTVSSVDPSTVGVYYVTYTVSDNEGNNSQATRTVVVGSPPVITLQGANPLQQEAGSTYVELGANAFDATDGDVSDQISISESINTSILGSYSVQYSIIDSDGNSTVLYRAVEVSDTTSPEIELVGDEQMTIEANGSFSDPGATATDSFEGDLTDQISDSGTVDTTSLGNYTITYQVSDSSGNTANASRQVTVSDTTAPVISLTGSSPVSIEVGTTYTDEGATATDDFQGDLTASIIDTSNVDTTTVGTYSVVYNVSDSSGNLANQVTRVVEVVDSQAPVLSFVGGATITHEAKTLFNIPLDVTATDNYDADLSSAVVVSGIVNQDLIGSYNLSYSVTDSSGNTAQLSRTVNVVDTTNPIITLTGDNPLYVNLGQTFTDPGYSANDNYDGNITSTVVESGPIDTFTEGTYYRNYNVNDSSSNAAIQQTRTVVVGSPPVITLNGNNPMQLEYQEAYVEPNATATDGGVDLSSSILINGSVNENQLGTYNIIYSVTDSDGNSVTETRVVNVVDTTKPEITLLGSVSETIEVDTSFTDAGYTVSDNYDSSLTVTVSGAVDTSTLGTYTIDYQTTDSQGNVADVKTRTLTVVDTQEPVMSLIGDLSQTIQVKSSYTEQGVSAIDNYDGNISSSVNITGTVDVNAIGTYTIDYDVSDSSGNDAIGITRTVVVVDTEAPVITLAGDADITLEAGSSYSDAGASVADNYNSGLTASVDLSSLDLSTIGVYTLTYSVSDSSGNAATPVYRTITIVDTQAPTITLVGNPTIDVQAGTTYVDPGFTATDIYDGDLTAQVLVTGTVDTSILGVITLTYDVSDSSSNDAPTKTRTVRVVDTTKPVITLQGNETINVELGSSFNDPGYSGYDNLDGDLTNSIIKEGSVDPFAAGVYTIIYKLVDSQGNVAQQVTRTVIVGSPPVISLDGDNPMTLEVGTPYVEPGATALDDDEGDLTNQIQISGTVDENQLGQSNIVYTVEDSNGNITNATRIVNVVDTTPPVLVLDNASIITIEVFSPEYVDQTEFTYTDNFDQNISDSDVIVTDNINENVVGNYSISFNLSDASGNAAVTQIRQVQVVDTQSPTIILTGDSNVSIEKGSSYIDEGATAQDEYDGNITSSIVVTSNVNESVIGDYSVTYEVSDSSNNPATPVSRSVVVGPDVDAGGPYSVACIGETINIGSASNDLNYDYKWTSQPQPGATGGPVFGDPNSPQTAVTVYTTTLFTLKAYDNNGVEVGSDQVQVDVSGLPEAIVTNPQTICQGESIDLGDSPVSGNSYFWTADSSGWTSTLANPSHSPQSTTTYTLTITNIATGCQDTDQVTITVEEPPVVSLGSDNDTICASEAAIGYTFSAATSTSNNVTHEWSVIGGNGSFDNENILNATYFPGSDDLQTGSASLRLTTISQGVCTVPVISNFDLNITKEPSIEAGVSAVELCENKSYELNASGTNFDPSSIVWTSSTGDNSTITGGNTLTPTYTPSAGDVASGDPITLTISVTGLDPCDDNGAITDSVTIDLIELPDVSVGTSNASICEDETYQIVGASADNVSSFNWTTSGNGSFDNSTSINPTYTPSNDDIDAGTVTLSLNYVPVSPCALPNDFTPPSMTLTISKNPIVDAGAENQVFCEGPNQIQGAIAENYSSLLWTTSGDGQFTSDNTLSPFYSPGVGDLSNGVVTLTLKAVGEGACTATVESSLNFSVNKVPIISAGADDEVCSLDNYEISDASIIDSDGNNLTPTSILWSSSGSGTFNNPAILNPIYIPSDGDIANNEVVLTMTVTQNGCQLNPDSKILSFVSTATANAGPDLNECENEDAIFTQASVPVGHNFSWQIIQGSGTLQNESDINPIYQPSNGESGEVILRLTVNPIQVDGADCGLAATDDVSIFYEQLPIIEAGPNVTICQPQDDNAVLSYEFQSTDVSATNENVLTWSTNGTGTFSDLNILTPTYFPSNQDIVNGVVQLTLSSSSNAPCNDTVSDVMVLEITRKPVINAPATIEQCFDAGDIVIADYNLTYDFFSFPQDTVLWTSNSTGVSGDFDDATSPFPTYTPSSLDLENGQVILTVQATNQACSTVAESSILVLFEDLPRVNAGPGDTSFMTPGIEQIAPETDQVCEGNTYQLSGAVEGGNNLYVWSTSGTGSFNNPNSTDPIYTPSAQDIANGVPIELRLTNVSTSSCNYEIYDSVMLEIVPGPVMEIGDNRTLCEGEDLEINNLVEGANVDNVDTSTYLWTSSGTGTFNSNNSLNTTYSPSEADLDLEFITITLQANAVSPCGGIKSDSFDISIQRKPTVDAGPDLTICESGGQITVPEENVANYSSFTWSHDGSGVFENENTLAPTYKPGDNEPSNQVTVTLTLNPIDPCIAGVNNDSVSDSVVLTLVEEPEITLPATAEICEGDTYTFLPNSVTLENHSSFAWSSDTGGTFANNTGLSPTYTPSDAEIAAGEALLKLTAQPLAPCENEVVGTMTLEIKALPVITLFETSSSLCESDPYYSTNGSVVSNSLSTLWTTSGSGSFDNASKVETNYNPSEEDRNLGFVTLTLSATPLAPCEPENIVSDQITLTFTPSPTVSILRGDTNNDGVDEYPTEFCGSTDYQFTDDQIIVTNVASLQWTTNGDGTISDPTSEFPTYSPGDFDRQNGSVILTLTVTDVDNCESVFDSITLTVLDGPSLDLTTSANSACYGTPVQLTAIAENYDSILWELIGGTGQILSGADTLTPIYNPSLEDSNVTFRVSLTGQEPCNDPFPPQELTLTVTQNPEITDFPTSTEVCFDQNQINVQGVTTSGDEDSIQWSSSGTGTFSNLSIPEPTYFPSQEDIINGSVTLTLTAKAAAPCSVADDVSQSYTVTLTPAPVINMSPTDQVCVDSPYTDFNVTIENSDTFSWATQGDGTLTDFDTLTPTYVPGEADKANLEFTLVLTAQGNGVCDETIATKTVTIIPNPIVELSLNSADYCTSDNPDIDNIQDHDNPITVEVQNIQNYSSLVWSTSSESGIIQEEASGSAIFYPSQEDYDNGQVTITLSANPLSPCPALGNDSRIVEDTIVITFNQAPIVDADITSENNILPSICEDQSSVQLNASASNYNTLLWTTSGNGTFSDETSLSSSYSPSVEDINAGNVILTLTAVGDIDCGPRTSDVSLSFTKTPQVIIGETVIDVCQPLGDEEFEVTFNDVTADPNTYSAILWFTSNGTGLLTNENTLTPTYKPADGETGTIEFKLRLTPVAPCTTEPLLVSKTINIVDAATADAGDDFEVCEADGDITISGASVANNSSLTWTVVSGTGLLTEVNTETPKYSPSELDWTNGSVTLKLTAIGNEGCDNAEDQVTINLISSPEVFAGNDTTICQDSTYVTSSASVQNTTNFEWTTPDGSGQLISSLNDTNATYIPGINEEGTITLRLTAQSDGSCTEVVVDEMKLTINPPPTSNIITDNLTICNGEQASIVGEVTNELNFYWSANLADGTAASGTFSPANSLNTTYSPSPSDYQEGAVTITLHSIGLEGCDPVDDSILLSFTGSEILLAGQDLDNDGLTDPVAICQDETFDLTPVYNTDNVSNPGWTAVNGTGTFTNTSIWEPTYIPSQDDINNGSVTLRLTVDTINDPCSATRSDDITIEITPPPVITNIIPSFNVCEGTHTITGTTIENYSTVEWTPIHGDINQLQFRNSLEPVYQTNDDDVVRGFVEFEVEAFGLNGCQTVSVKERVILNVSPTGNVNAGTDVTICETTSSYTFTNGAIAENVNNIIWSHNGLGQITAGQGSVNPTYTPVEGEVGNIIFTLTADNLAPCFGDIFDTVELTIVGEPTIDAGATFITCGYENQPIPLNATSTNAISIQWSGGNGQFNNLDPSVGNNPLLLEGNEINQSVNYYPTVQELQQGFVSLLVEANPITPCSPAVSDVITIQFSNPPLVDAGSDSVSICAGDSYTLDQASLSNYDALSNPPGFIWETDGSGEFSAQVLNPVYTPSEADIINGSVTLKLTAEGNSNCSNDFDEITIIIDQPPTVNIPDSFIAHCGTDGQGNVLPISLSDVTGNHIGSVQWFKSAGSDGTFNDVNSLTPVFTPGPNDLENGVTLTVTVTGEPNKACSDIQPISDLVNVTFDAPPVVYAGLDQEICEDPTDLSPSIILSTATAEAEAEYYLWETSGTGTFDNETNLNAEYFPSINDFESNEDGTPKTITLTLTGYNNDNSVGCRQFSDEMTLTLTSMPVIIAEKEVFNLCNNLDSFVLDGISVLNVPNTSDGSPNIQWTTSGNGYFETSNTILQPRYRPIGDDYINGVSFQIAAFGEGDCGFVERKNIVVQFVPEISVNLGQSALDEQIICEGDSYTISTAQVFGTEDFYWNSPNGSGFFSSTNTKQTIYFPSPEDIESFQSGGNTPIILELIANPSYNSDGDILCPSASDEIKLIIEPLAAPYAGNDVTICSDEPFYEITDAFVKYSNGQPIPEDQAPQVLWSTLDGSQLGFTDPTSVNTQYFPQASDLSQGFVTLVLRTPGNGVCDTNPSDTVTLTFFEAIEAYAGADSSVCYEGPSTTFTVTDAEIISSEDSYDSFEWKVIEGDGTLDFEKSLFPVYNLGPLDQNNGVVRLELEVIPKTSPGNFSCAVPPAGSFVKTIYISEDLVGTGSIDGPDEVCAGTLPYSFEVTDLEGAVDYDWTLPSGATIVDDLGDMVILSFESFTEDQNVNISVLASNDCPGQQQLMTKSFTIKASPILNSDPLNDLDQSLCYEQDMNPVRFTVSGGDFELPTVAWDVEPAWANVQISPTGVIEISGTPSEVLGSNTTYTYTVNVENSSVTCGGNDTKTGQITIISTPTLTLTDATAEDQSLCEGDQLIDIIYNLGNGADDVVFNWTSVEPIGVSADFSISGNSFEIKGTPQVVDPTTIFTYEITPIISSDNCQGDKISGSFTLNASSALISLTQPLENGQQVCESDTLEEIQYSVGSALTNVVFTWEKCPLNSDCNVDNDSDGEPDNRIPIGTPPGVQWDLNTDSGYLRVYGSPIENITEPFVYYYTIQPIGNACDDTAKTGSFTVLVEPKLEIDPSSGSLYQRVCAGLDIDPIIFNLVDGAQQAQVTGLPNSVTYVTIDNSGDPNTPDQLVISGQVDAGNINDVFTFVVTAQNPNGQCFFTQQGEITINRPDELQLISNGLESQTICEGESIDDVTYFYSGGATGTNVQWRTTVNSTSSPWSNTPPSGFSSFDDDNGTLVISGGYLADITVTTEVEFKVTTTNDGCFPGTEPEEFGVITVQASPEIQIANPPTYISGSVNQTVCENEEIDEIILETSGADEILITWADSSNKPLGITTGRDDTNTDIFKISGRPQGIDQDALYSFSVIAVNNSTGCVSEKIDGSLNILRAHELTRFSSPQTETQTICEGESIQTIGYEFGGGANNVQITGLPNGVSYEFVPNTNRVEIIGAPQINTNNQAENTFTYTVETIGVSSCASLTETGTITIISNPVIQLSSIASNGSPNQTICENTPLVEISFDVINTADSVQIIWGGDTPAWIDNSSLVGGKYMISGTPTNITQDTTFNYTIKALNQTNGCESAEFNGSITVLNSHDLELISSPLTAQQTFCEGEPLPDIIRYEFGGGATSARVLGNLPTGITWNVSSNFLEISGTPTVNVSGTPTDFNYTIETIGTGPCSSTTKTGTITLIPEPVISLSTTLGNGSPNQTVCENIPLTEISFDVTDIADNVQISWTGETPLWIDQSSLVGGKYTISGTPTNILQDTTYNYTLQAFNQVNGCQSDLYSGSITVLSANDLDLISPQQTASQSLCEGEALPQTIRYEFGGGATSARVLGNLPTGISWDILPGNILEISGTPTVNVDTTEQVFSYTVETIGPSCDPATETGTITIIPNPQIQISNTGGSPNQILCEGTPIDDIVFNVIDNSERVEILWNVTPTGISHQFDPKEKEFVISGTPINIDSDISYNYTLKAVNDTNGCESQIYTGNIDVNAEHELTLLSGSSSTLQSVCESQTLAFDITYQFGGGATSARAYGLPPGLNWQIESGNILRISGDVIGDITSEQTFDYTVETVGNSCNGGPSNPLQEVGTITVYPDSDAELITPFSTSQQFICEGEDIEQIEYRFTAGTSGVIFYGLPPGVTGNYNDVTKVLTISGKPNQDIEIDTQYDYTVKALNENGCESPELTGIINLKANAELTVLSGSLSETQSTCVDNQIRPIILRFTNSNIPVVENLPSGLFTSTDGDIFKIEGSPDEGGIFDDIRIIGTNTQGCSSEAIPIKLTVVPFYIIEEPIYVENPLSSSNPTGASYVKNISCSGRNDGEIFVNMSVPLGIEYVYSWQGPNSYINTTRSNHIKNLPPGTYNLSVYAQGEQDCAITQSFDIVEPEQTQIITNQIVPVTCTGSDDGLISVSLSGGNTDFYKNFIWELLEEDISCTKYTVRLRDADTDGIFDIVDADINNDGNTDPGKVDSNNDGYIDGYDDDDYSYGIVSYQTCEGIYVTNNILAKDFSQNGIYEICAVPNTVTSDANLDHDLDDTTPLISSVSISGGTSSCSSGTWNQIERLRGSSYADNLSPGLYRLTVVEGTDLTVLESNDLDKLLTNQDLCITQEFYELKKDQILYGSVRVDETYCSLSGGYIDVELNQDAGNVYFRYNGVRVDGDNVQIIAAEFGINTYRILIENPISQGTLEIRNDNGCGVVVAQDLLNANVIPPAIAYTSPELERYGTISERSMVQFTLANNTSYNRVEWDFGDASPIASGDRVSHQYFADGTYNVTVYVYNASGCYASSSEEIIVGKGYTLLMPNAFSPNGDNINEIIGPVFTGLKSVDFLIYNELGILIYQEFVSETNLSPDGTIEIKGWDGTNSDPSSNFYVYKIIGVRINDEIVIKTGTIFLIE